MDFDNLENSCIVPTVFPIAKFAGLEHRDEPLVKFVVVPLMNYDIANFYRRS